MAQAAGVAMMHWRCANRRRKRLGQLCGVESHLGDVIGAIAPQPLAPMRPLPRSRPRGQHWIHSAVATVLGWCAVTAWSLFLAAWIVVAFYLLPMKSAPAQEARQSDEDRIVVLTFTCRDIKHAVAQYGRALVLARAKQHGISDADLRNARRCLRRR